MYPIPAKCPVCTGELHAERLVCSQCGTVIEGAFVLRRMAQLSPEQWEFVETFLRCEGKLNRVQEEIGISYPTARGRLHAVIRALGYEVGSAPDTEPPVQQSVLDELAKGQITIDEAVRLLKQR
ncbi:MAG: DUF2089 domain-containing protein [Anaerolineae bacterium]|nr:DUF2089 domain-containing protein [Anaerolineae bacterium]